MTTLDPKATRFSSSQARTAFAAAIVLLLAQIGGNAAPVPGELPFTKSFTVTGDYVVGGVDLKEDVNPPDADGMSTGEIVMSGVPADADIVAAYLFWETITTTAELSEVPPLPSLTGVKAVKFRGTPIDVNNPVFVKRSSSPTLTIQNSPCFGNQIPLTTHQFRADVLALL